MTIGDRIKEHRKKNGLTQEKLAEYLNVSYQAISKWECGISTPDLSLIGPLTKLLHISADNLLGLDNDADDKKRKEFDEDYEKYLYDQGNIESYHSASEAVREYPGDYRYLEWLATSEYLLALNESLLEGDSEKFSYTYYHDMIENSMRHYQIIIDDCTDQVIRNNSICGMILALKLECRDEEASWYAETVYPESPVPDKGTVIGWTLSADDMRKHQQKQIVKYSEALINQLISVKSISDSNMRDIGFLTCAEKLINLLVTDENYLQYYDWLFLISIFKAQHYQYTDLDESISSLRDAYNYAVKFDEIFIGSSGIHKHTTPILDMIEINTENYVGNGELEKQKRTESFRNWINSQCFGRVRECSEFKTLLTEQCD